MRPSPHEHTLVRFEKASSRSVALFTSDARDLARVLSTAYPLQREILRSA